MSAREQILEMVRTSGRQSVPLPKIPNFAGDPQDLSQKFESAIKMVAGSVVRDPPKDFDQFLRDAFPSAKTICSTAPEVRGNHARGRHPRMVKCQSDRCNGCSLSPGRC